MKATAQYVSSQIYETRNGRKKYECVCKYINKNNETREVWAKIYANNIVCIDDELFIKWDPNRKEWYGVSSKG